MLRPLPPHIAPRLKMSGFILGMLHLREVSGKADPFCSMSEYPPVVSVLAVLFSVERKYGSQGREVAARLVFTCM